MKKRLKKFIIDVVPLTRIPLGRSQSFSYLHDQKLSTGTLVSIPLFRRNVEGIVLNSRSDFKRLGGIELKKVEKIIEETFLDKSQIELAQFISDYYFSPLGIVLKSFVPKRTKARVVKSQERNHRAKMPAKITLTKEQIFAVQSIATNQKPPGLPADRKNKSYLLFGPSGSGKTEVYIHAILEIQKKYPEKQSLILLPELILTPQALERYGAYFKQEEIVVLSSNESRGQFYKAWQKIKSGKAKLIIGTRMAVFAPFQKLGLIVIDEEQDISYKQWDMNPRYDARMVAQKLSKIHACPVVLGSATPRVEDYYRTTTKEFSLLTLPQLDILGKKTVAPEIIVVDMRRERWEKNHSPLSKKLRSEIVYALKHKKQIILFLNRQGRSAFSICEKCKEVLKCPKCNRALIYSNEGNYRCLHCSYKTSIFPKCPKCSGLTFKNLGLGTQKIEKEIKELFPSAKILRADQESTRKIGSTEEIYQKFSSGMADILIGTQMISKGWDLPNVALVGIIDIDNLLTIPDSGTNEKVFSLILQLAGRTNRPIANFPGTVIAQTFNPGHPLIQAASQKNFFSFYQTEIKDKQALFLPPFSQVIKLIFQDTRLTFVQKETQRVFSQLEKELPKKIKYIKITPPQDCFVSKIRGRFRKQILLKFTKEVEKRVLENVLNKLPTGWIIDVDPVSLI